MNVYTELTYFLEHYGEVKDIKDCNKIYKKLNDKVKNKMTDLLHHFN